MFSIPDNTNTTTEETAADDVNKENETKENETEESDKADKPQFFMGSHPDESNVGDAEIISEVADRMKIWLKEGVSWDEKSDILALVPRKHPICNMEAPKLNEEIKLNIKEEAIKRDKYFYNYQNLLGSSLSLTAMALSMILNDKNEAIDRDLLLQYLSDAVKIEADLFHSWITARKVYITPAFDKKVKAVLDKAEPSEFLFGDNIKELINGVKTVEKIGKDLKTNNKSSTPQNNLNWRSSPAWKGVNQGNQKPRNYFTSRASRGKSYTRPYQQRTYNQSQPMKRKN